ncbi:Uncharacterised protein [Burkholderia pseudomallei]|nr:Uncharacterised protein [Burkholderia pseudomallei]VBR21766.1 Uncharacterised protein [Burkholderia pseudomallei]VBU18875.1 Uncharacterised protein [Burkholderia pseudomallei]VBU48911.1 Uncharacterised protein [Burkholderia pseudomallei]
MKSLPRTRGKKVHPDGKPLYQQAEFINFNVMAVFIDAGVLTPTIKILAHEDRPGVVATVDQFVRIKKRPQEARQFVAHALLDKGLPGTNTRLLNSGN